MQAMVLEKKFLESLSVAPLGVEKWEKSRKSGKKLVWTDLSHRSRRIGKLYSLENNRNVVFSSKKVVCSGI